MLFLLSPLALADRPAAFDAPTDAVREYLVAADARDTRRVERSTHDDFRVVARMPDGLSVIDRATYLSLLDAKKIGGVPREASFTAVLQSGELATVKGTLASTAADFDSTWTVAKTAEGWKVVQDATIFVPR